MIAPRAAVGAVLAIGLFAGRPALAADSARGQTVFQDRCSLCHGAEGGGQGPSLAGVVGRKAGTLPSFPYTDALKKSGIVWTPSMLDKFLAAPATLVPGTAMGVAVSNPIDRQDLISYLASTPAKR